VTSRPRSAGRRPGLPATQLDSALVSLGDRKRGTASRWTANSGRNRRGSFSGNAATRGCFRSSIKGALRRPRSRPLLPRKGKPSRATTRCASNYKGRSRTWALVFQAGRGCLTPVAAARLSFATRRRFSKGVVSTGVSGGSRQAGAERDPRRPLVKHKRRASGGSGPSRAAQRCCANGRAASLTAVGRATGSRHIATTAIVEETPRLEPPPGADRLWNQLRNVL